MANYMELTDSHGNPLLIDIDKILAVRQNRNTGDIAVAIEGLGPIALSEDAYAVLVQRLTGKLPSGRVPVIQVP